MPQPPSLFEEEASGVLELEGASYAYPGASSPALLEASLVVRPGEHVCLLGNNGSGKSTLARLCNGSIVPSRGKVRVEGIDTSAGASARSEAARLVGFVRQDPVDQLVSASVFDEVAFGPMNLGLAEDEVRRRVERSLETCGLAGYEKRGVGELSGGELQRLAVAGVLAMEPAYLLLDEATAQLDGPSRQSLRRLVGGLRDAGHGIVEITHDVDGLLGADGVVVMSGGRIVWRGTPKEFLSSDEAIETSTILRDTDVRLRTLLARNGMSPSDCPDAEDLVLRLANAGLVPEVREILGSSDGVVPPRAPRGEGLSLDSVSVDFDGRQALDDVSLDVAPGEVLLVAGLSGSGKTTLARVIAGLLAPDTGTAFVDGVPAVPGGVGLSFQRSVDQLFCDTVIDDVAFGPKNLGMGPQRASQAAKEALARLGVSPAVWERSPFALSGGQARRVALAGMLSFGPAACVLDEPTAGLDGRGRSFLHALVRELAEAGRPVIVVSHDVGEWVDVADEVALMRGGRIVWRGPAAEAACSGRPYRLAGLVCPLAVSLREALPSGGDAHVA